MNEGQKSSEQTELELSLVETKTEPVDFNSEISLGLESIPTTSSSSQDIPPDSKTKVYLKPPMSPELMIAIAVRNLDPQKVVGASCSDIVAFLCLHFPYFTDNYQECKDMVRRECGMGAGFESGKENFQMKAEINCYERIHAYVRTNRDKISRLRENQGLCSKDLPGQHSILSMLGIIFDESVAET